MLIRVVLVVMQM